jgi:hypothetical protein
LVSRGRAYTNKNEALHRARWDYPRQKQSATSEKQSAKRRKQSAEREKQSAKPRKQSAKRKKQSANREKQSAKSLKQSARTLKQSAKPQKQSAKTLKQSAKPLKQRFGNRRWTRMNADQDNRLSSALICVHLRFHPIATRRTRRRTHRFPARCR